jgi:adenylate kinase family enzyme
MEVKLLTEDQRLVLPQVILRRNQFKAILDSFIKNRGETFSNAIIISGKPGTGKTTLVNEFLDQLVEQDLITDYKRTSGHMTKVALFDFLRPEWNEQENHIPTVHVIDDCDCIYNYECVEIMKSAFDTKSNSKSNRMVYYKSGYNRDQYKYLDFCIIITNDDFQDYVSDEMRALLDRVHLFNIDLEVGDFKIFNTYLVEKYLNDNPDNLSEEVINSIMEFYEEYVEKWFYYNSFSRAGINFSIRLIRKFVDLMILFGNDWKAYSMDYKRLNKYTYEIERKDK